MCSGCKGIAGWLLGSCLGVASSGGKMASTGGSGRHRILLATRALPTLKRTNMSTEADAGCRSGAAADRAEPCSPNKKRDNAISVPPLGAHSLDARGSWREPNDGTLSDQPWLMSAQHSAAPRIFQRADGAQTFSSPCHPSLAWGFDLSLHHLILSAEVLSIPQPAPLGFRRA